MAIFTGMTMGVLTLLVSDITATGLSLVGDVTGEELELAETDAILRGPVSVSLDLMKADDMIAVTGVLEGTVVRQCVRCLKEYDDAVAFSVHANRNRASLARDGREQQKPKQMSKPKTKAMTDIFIKATTSSSPPCFENI